MAHSLLPHATAGDSILSVRIRKELIFHSLLPLMPKHEALLHFFLSPLSGSPSDAHKYLILSGDDVLNASMHSVFKILILEYVNMLPGYDTLLDSALSMLFSLFSRCYCADNFKNPSSQSEILIDNILKYLSRNCATATLKDVAEKFNYHPNYLSTILQKETGKTFSELILSLIHICYKFKFTRVIYEEIAACRFASGMALTLSSGLNPERSMELVSALNDDVHFQKKIDACQSLIDEGQDLAEALHGTGILTGMYARMASIGAKTGSMDQVMDNIAGLYQDDIDTRMNNSLAVLEPTLVIALSLIVGVILLSVMLPLMGIMSSI